MKKAVTLWDCDDAVFGKELTDSYPKLRAFAAILGRKRHIVEDLVQDTMIMAWKARRQFKPGSNLGAWLFMIMRNRHYSTLRRTWNEIAAFPDFNGNFDNLRWTEGSQESTVELRETLRIMEEVTTPEQHQALVLVGVCGLTYEEATTVIGCVLGTTKSRVARARAAILDRIEGVTEGKPMTSEVRNTKQQLAIAHLREVLSESLIAL